MGAKEACAALEWADTLLGGSHGQPCIVLGEQAGGVLGGQTHCLRTLSRFQS